MFVQGLGKLSVVAASAAQSAANVVQAGTKEFTTKVYNLTTKDSDIHICSSLSVIHIPKTPTNLEIFYFIFR